MQHITILSLGIGLGLTFGAVAVGCSATSGELPFGNTGGNDVGGAGGSGGQTSTGGQAGMPGTGGSGGEGGFFFPMDGGGGAPPEMPGEVFGHSSSTLYKLEPISKQVTVVGPFQGC